MERIITTSQPPNSSDHRSGKGRVLPEPRGDDAIGIPREFRLARAGLFWARPGRDGLSEWERISSPIKVVAQVRRDKRAWAKAVQFQDPDGNLHEHVLPMSLFASDGREARAELYERGLEIEPTRIAKEGLIAYLVRCNPAARAVAVRRTGWDFGGQVFVLSDQTIGELFNEERVIYAAAQEYENPYRISGTLEEWRESVANLCLGNSRLTFGISASAAANVLFLTEDEGGGINNFGASSQGKSTVLIGSGSWAGGGGVRGYVQQWQTTANALEATASRCCDTPLILDEMGLLLPATAATIAYSLANGQGKARANVDGSGRPVAVWRILFQSSSETTLQDKIQEDRGRRATAGQAVRVLDIPADTHVHGCFENLHGCADGAAFSALVRTRARQYYGTPMREFIQRLIEDTNGAIEFIEATRKSFSKSLRDRDNDGQVQRALDRFALIAAAGELATQYGITGWPKGESISAATKCYKAWLESRGSRAPLEIARGIVQIRHFIEQHGESRFEQIGGNPDGRVTYNRVGFRRETDKGTQYLVMTEAWKELCAGFNSRDIARALAERHLLTRDKEGKTSINTNIPALRKYMRVYILDPSII